MRINPPSEACRHAGVVVVVDPCVEVGEGGCGVGVRLGARARRSSASAVGAMSAIETRPGMRVESETRIPRYPGATTTTG